MDISGLVLDHVPVSNLLRLAFYAGEMLEELEDCEAAWAEGIFFHELLAAMLANATERIRRGGFDRGYSAREDCGLRPRGRVQLGGSVSRLTLARNQLVHDYDEFDEDTPDNRVLKSAARILARVCTERSGSHEELATALGAVSRDMRGVTDVQLSRRMLQGLPRSVASRRYRVSRYVARLLTECAEPDEAEGTDWARQLLQDGRRMRRLFERFVVRWAKANARRGTRVGRTRYAWSDDGGLGSGLVLPTLNTDVTLRRRGWTRIVECKYTPHLLDVSRHSGEEQLRADHLRQLYSYLARDWAASRKSAAPDREPPIRPSGLILYPTVGRALDVCFELGAFRAQVATLDLAQPWPSMTHRLGTLMFDGSPID